MTIVTTSAAWCLSTGVREIFARGWQGAHEGRPYMLCLFCLKCRGDPRGRPLELYKNLMHTHPPSPLDFHSTTRYTIGVISISPLRDRVRGMASDLFPRCPRSLCVVGVFMSTRTEGEIVQMDGGSSQPPTCWRCLHWPVGKAK